MPYTDVASLAPGNNVSFNQIDINAGTLPIGNQLDLNLIGTNTTNLSYNFPGSFTVASGATLAVGISVPVQVLPPGQTLTDNGTLSFADGETVSLNSNCCSTAASDVAGTMTASGPSFNSNGNDSAPSPSTPAAPSRPLKAPSTCALFVLPTPMWRRWQPATMQGFHQIDINAGTLPSGIELDLNLIGTNTTNLSYNFPSGFIGGVGGNALAVGTNVPFQVLPPGRDASTDNVPAL